MPVSSNRPGFSQPRKSFDALWEPKRYQRKRPRSPPRPPGPYLKVLLTFVRGFIRSVTCVFRGRRRKSEKTRS